MGEPRRPNDTPRADYPAYRDRGKLLARWGSMVAIALALTTGGGWITSACSKHEVRHAQTEDKVDRLEKLEGTVTKMSKLLIRISERMGIEE